MRTHLRNTWVEFKVKRFHHTLEQAGPRCELAVLHHLEAWEQLLTHLSFRGLSFPPGVSYEERRARCGPCAV